MATKQSEAGFARSVQAALSHYHDSIYLESHSLLTRGGAADQGQSADQTRSWLNEAIEGLRPANEVPETSRLWRAYRLIYMRYVEARDPGDVQRQLSLSRSPYYEEHDRALQAVAAFLRKKLAGEDSVAPEDGRDERDSEPLAFSRWLSRSLQAFGRLLTRPIPAGMTVAIAVLSLASGLALAQAVETFGRGQNGSAGPGARIPKPPSGGPAVTSRVGGPQGRLLYQDDFTDASERLFVQERSGYFGMTNIGSDGIRRSVPWSVQRGDGGFRARLGLIEPPSTDPAVPGFFAGNFAGAEHRFSGDVAFEVSGKATQNFEQAVYGLVFNPGVRRFAYAVLPGDQHYYLFDILSGSGSLRAGHADGVRMGDGINRLRIEARGVEIRMFLNDEEIDRGRDESFGGRPAVVGVYFARRSSSIGEDVEINFHDFRIYSLDP